MRIHPLAVLAPCLTLLLAGCPGPTPFMPITGVQGYPGPTEPYYPGRYPSPAPSDYPGTEPSTTIGLMDGLSLDDAHQQVRRYLALHYSGAELVSVQSMQVGVNARIPKQASWTFTYLMKQRLPSAAPSSPSVQSVEIPSQFDSEYLTFTLSGTGVLHAPEAKKRLGHDAGIIQYAQVLPLSQAMEIAQSYGMGMGFQGVSVFLKPNAEVGAVYELDNSLYSSGFGGSYGTYRGKFVIDAYTGELIERPTKL